MKTDYTARIENLEVPDDARCVLESGVRVDGNLQCKENRPAPSGSRNVVQGNKEDQCANF